MNEAFEKILEFIDEQIKIEESIAKSENEGHPISHQYGANCMNVIKKFVEEVAEEYNDGWIPCSERLPEDDSICIVTVEYPNNKTMVDYGWFDRKGVCWFVGMQEFRTSNILAWQPLPEPFKEHD